MPQPKSERRLQLCQGIPNLPFQQKLLLVGSDCAFAVMGSNSAVNGFPTSVASELLKPTAILFVVFAFVASAVAVPFAVLAV